MLSAVPTKGKEIWICHERGHFVDVRCEDDLDERLRAWLRESHDTVGVQDDLA